jgi:hypothetical protein
MIIVLLRHDPCEGTVWGCGKELFLSSAERRGQVRARTLPSWCLWAGGGRHFKVKAYSIRAGREVLEGNKVTLVPLEIESNGGRYLNGESKAQ